MPHVIETAHLALATAGLTYAFERQFDLPHPLLVSALAGAATVLAGGVFLLELHRRHRITA